MFLLFKEVNRIEKLKGQKKHKVSPLGFGSLGLGRLPKNLKGQMTMTLFFNENPGGGGEPT